MATKETATTPSRTGSQNSSVLPSAEHLDTSAQPVVYKVYKRRYIGLIQLFLLNVVASWDVSFTYRASGQLFLTVV
jgi:hypothetical protein